MRHGVPDALGVEVVDAEAGVLLREQNCGPPEQSLGVGVAVGGFEEQYWGPPEHSIGVGVAVGAAPEQYCGPGEQNAGFGVA